MNITTRLANGLFFDVFDLEKKLTEKDDISSNDNQEDHHEHHNNAD